jgi:hypothetical protein
MPLGRDSSDPLNYVSVLKKYGSRAKLDRAAALGDIEARLWREAPSVMARAERERERAAAAAASLRRTLASPPVPDTSQSPQSSQSSQSAESAE